MSNAKILLVEDDEMMLSLLDFKLKEAGYEVEVCTDGEAAKSKIESKPYDLVVSDIMMPYLNGLELTSLIRDDLKIDTPIVLLSASGNESTIIEAFEKGANDFVAKPFSPIELMLRIKKLIG